MKHGICCVCGRKDSILLASCSSSSLVLDECDQQIPRSLSNDHGAVDAAGAAGAGAGAALGLGEGTACTEGHSFVNLLNPSKRYAITESSSNTVRTTNPSSTLRPITCGTGGFMLSIVYPCFFPVAKLPAMTVLMFLIHTMDMAFGTPRYDVNVRVSVSVGGKARISCRVHGRGRACNPSCRKNQKKLRRRRRRASKPKEVTVLVAMDSL